MKKLTLKELKKQVSETMPITFIVMGLVDLLILFANYTYTLTQLSGLDSEIVKTLLIFVSSTTVYGLTFVLPVLFIGIILYVNQKFKELKQK